LLFALNLTAQVVDSTNSVIKIISDSTFAMQDSLMQNDSLLTEAKRDSIAPIYSSTLSDKYFIISNHNLSHSDYKYTGDYLRLFPLNFTKDLGFSGQPNETFLYGVGNNSISYLVDGISVNDRYSNSLNLNLIQSEDVDSIEIVPLPRGFLYGAYSNPVSVNFITNDFITKQPYTRIKFYQGANRDMMFDGSFNARVTNKLIASFNITNRILDETYDATDYSIWQGKFKLKYLLSNDVNIIASYNINDYKAGYSGGVDIDSIIASGRNVTDVMYSSLGNPPMFYPNGRLNTLTHLPRLRVLATPTTWLKTDASVFYLYRDYENITNGSELIENKTYGFQLNNIADYSILNFKLNFNYENTYSYIYRSNYNKYFPTLLSVFTDETNNDLLSLSGIVSVLINDSSFIPSVFYKTSSYNDFASNGYGIDLSLKLKPNLIFYFGGSVLEGYYNSNFDFSFIELGSKYINDFLLVDVKYFINDYSNIIYTGGMFYNSYRFGDLTGLGINLSIDCWKLNLESRSSYYSSKNNQLIGIPKFQTQTGLYFKDILFDNNLDLKTGFIFYYISKHNAVTYENGLIEVPASNKLDFTLVGEIQKTAIVYFTWQNLLGNNYYLTPYYPMPGRSIRFGVAWEMFN